MTPILLQEMLTIQTSTEWDPIAKWHPEIYHDITEWWYQFLQFPLILGLILYKKKKDVLMTVAKDVIQNCFFQ